MSPAAARPEPRRRGAMGRAWLCLALASALLACGRGPHGGTTLGAPLALSREGLATLRPAARPSGLAGARLAGPQGASPDALAQARRDALDARLPCRRGNQLPAWELPCVQ